MKLIKPDYIPMLQDAGLDMTILSSFAHSIEMNELRMTVNSVIDFSIEIEGLKQYLADRGDLGLTVVDGELPPAIVHADAPTGLGQDGSGIWFTKPDDGTYTVRWYLNGALIVEREQDCVKDRSAMKAELGAEADDIVQVCVVVEGVVGWWSRITVE